MRIILFGLAVLLLGAAYLGWKLTARSSYESAEYTTVESEGAFEIRQYPELTMATTSMQFESSGDDGSFMRLFRYISGNNDEKQKVAMTTPVFMQPDGQMGFVLPKDIASDKVPQPSDNDVAILKRAGGRYAVYRFSGRMGSDSLAKAEAKLKQWLSEKRLEAKGKLEMAGYDPPWTPGPLRRNEILVRVK